MTSFVPQKYKRNAQIYRQGDSSEYVYIVIDGEFEVNRRRIGEKQRADNKERKYIGPSKAPKSSTYKIEKKTNFIDLKISIASQGQSIGFEDVINGRQYTTSVSCKSNEGSLYCIKNVEFL